MGIGFSINFVVVSPLAREAGLSERQVALVLVGSAALYAILTPYWARLAERFGRKRVMAFSMLASAVTNAAFAITLERALAGALIGISAFFTLAGVRLTFGLLAPGIHPASMAAMADATTAKTRAAGMGLIGAAMSIGAILGPASIAILVSFGRLAPLWGAIIFNFFCAILLMVALPATRKSRQIIDRPPALKLSDKRVRPYLIFLLSYFTAVGAIQQSIAWLVEDRFALSGAEAIRQSSYVFVSLSIVLVIMQFGYIQPKKPNPRNILVPGLIFIAIGYLITAFGPNIIIMSLGFAVVGIGAGLAVPSMNALGSMSVPVREQGQAASMLAFAPPAGYVAGPILGAELYRINGALPLIITAVFMGILALFASSLVTKDSPIAASNTGLD